MSTTPANSPKRTAIPSKFIEGSALTRPDLLQRNPSSNKLLFNILSEMDALEKKRKHRAGSSSSVESLTSSGYPSPIVGKQEARRSFGTARHSLEEKNHGEEKLSQKFKGRLRALTGGNRDDAKPLSYQGT